MTSKFKRRSKNCQGRRSKFEEDERSSKNDDFWASSSDRWMTLVKTQTMTKPEQQTSTIGISVIIGWDERILTLINRMRQFVTIYRWLEWLNFKKTHKKQRCIYSSLRLRCEQNQLQKEDSWTDSQKEEVDNRLIISQSPNLVRSLFFCSLLMSLLKLDTSAFFCRFSFLGRSTSKFFETF